MYNIPSYNNSSTLQSDYMTIQTNIQDRGSSKVQRYHVIHVNFNDLLVIFFDRTIVYTNTLKKIPSRRLCPVDDTCYSRAIRSVWHSGHACSCHRQDLSATKSIAWYPLHLQQRNPLHGIPYTSDQTIYGGLGFFWLNYYISWWGYSLRMSIDSRYCKLQHA